MVIIPNLYMKIKKNVSFAALDPTSLWVTSDGCVFRLPTHEERRALSVREHFQLEGPRMPPRSTTMSIVQWRRHTSLQRRLRTSRRRGTSRACLQKNLSIKQRCMHTYNLPILTHFDGPISLEAGAAQLANPPLGHARTRPSTFTGGK